MIKYECIYKEIEARPVKSTAQIGRPEVNPCGRIRAARERDGRRSGLTLAGMSAGRREKIPPAVAAMRSAIDVPEYAPGGGVLSPGKRCRRTDGTASRSSFHK